MQSARVTARERVTAWGSSVVVGVAMYFVFAAVLTAGPTRELAEQRGRIAAATARSVAPATKLSPAELKAALAETRATNAQLSALHRRREDLRQALRAKRFWAIAIGIVAGGGCFALCIANAYRRAAAEAAKMSL